MATLLSFPDVWTAPGKIIIGRIQKKRPGGGLDRIPKLERGREAESRAELSREGSELDDLACLDAKDQHRR